MHSRIFKINLVTDEWTNKFSDKKVLMMCPDYVDYITKKDIESKSDEIEIVFDGFSEIKTKDGVKGYVIDIEHLIQHTWHLIRDRINHNRCSILGLLDMAQNDNPVQYGDAESLSSRCYWASDAIYPQRETLFIIQDMIIYNEVRLYDYLLSCKNDGLNSIVVTAVYDYHS